MQLETELNGIVIGTKLYPRVNIMIFFLEERIFIQQQDYIWIMNESGLRFVIYRVGEK